MDKHRRSNGVKKKRGWPFVFFVGVFVALILLRHNLAEFAVDLALRRLFPQEEGEVAFAYSLVRWEGRTIVVDELYVDTPDYRAAVQRVEIVLGFTPQWPLIQPHIWVIRPYLVFQTEEPLAKIHSGQNPRFYASDSHGLQIAYPHSDMSIYKPDEPMTKSSYFGSEAVFATGSEVESTRKRGSPPLPIAILNLCKFDLVGGQCEWQMGGGDSPCENLYFQFASIENAIGELTFYSEPEMVAPPLAMLRLDEGQLYEEGLAAHLQLSLDSHRLIPLVCGLSALPIKGWDRLEGIWELDAALCFDRKGNLNAIHLDMDVQDLSLSNSVNGFYAAAKSASLQMQFPTGIGEQVGEQPIWFRQLDANLSLDQLEVELQHPLSKAPCRLSGVGGHVLWGQDQDPGFFLEGVLAHADCEEQIRLDGNGAIEPDHTFWVQAQLRYGNEKSPLIDAFVSLCSPSPDAFVLETEVKNLEAPYALLLAKSLFPSMLQKGEVSSGSIKGTATAWLEHGQLYRVDVRDVSLRDLQGCWGELYQVLHVDTAMEGRWDIDVNGIWQQKFLTSSIGSIDIEAAVLGQIGHLREIEGDLTLEEGQILAGRFRGLAFGAPFQLQVGGPWMQPSCFLHLSTDIDQIASFFPSFSKQLQIDRADCMPLELVVEAQPSREEYNLKGDLSLERDVHVEMGCRWAWKKGEIQEGYLRSVGFDLGTCQPILRSFLPNSSINGAIDFEGSFHRHGVVIDLKIADLNVESPKIALCIPPSESKEKGRFAWNWSDDQWSSFFPFSQTSFMVGESRVAFNALEGHLSLDPQGINLSILKGTYADHLKKSKVQVSSTFQGKCQFHAEKGIWDFCDIQGVLLLGNGHSFDWKLADGKWQEDRDGFRGEIDFCCLHQQKEFIRCFGNLHLNSSQLRFSLDQQGSHLFAKPIEQVECVVDLLNNSYQWRVHTALSLDQIPIITDFFSFDEPLAKLEVGLFEGCTDLDMSYDSRQECLVWQSSGHDLHLFGKPYQNYLCCGNQSKGKIFIERMELDDLLFEGALHWEQPFLSVPSFALRYGTLQLQGQGFFDLGQKTGRFLPSLIEIDRRVALSVKRPWIIDYSKEGEIEGKLEEGTCQISGVSFPLSQTYFRHRRGIFALSSKLALGERVLMSSMQLDLQEKLGVLRLQEPQIEQSLAAFFRFSPDKSFAIEKIVGECGGLKADLHRGAAQANDFSLVGSCDFDFAHLATFFPRSQPAPWEALKVGKGFHIEGELRANGFSWEQAEFRGRLEGRECVLLGIKLAKMESELVLNQRGVFFRQLSLSDPAGLLSAPTVFLEKKGREHWTVHCPFLQAQNVHPSSLCRVDGKIGPTKAFMIRNCTMTDFQGDLTDLESLSGVCHLHFTNLPKKESSLFDFPLGVLKDLGLEPSLLMPLQGELEGHLAQGKILFTDLKSSYSEGQRTQFLLSPKGEGSYIDLNGKIHIDLILKQAVLFKLAESFTIGIRGTLEKPSYTVTP